MKNCPLIAIFAMMGGVICAAPVFAQGLPGAAVHTQDAAAPADRDPMKGRMQQRCKDNPQQCADMKAKLQERREQCQADPQKCRDEMKAQREARCKGNPQRCEEMKAKMKARREQCQADPQKCRAERRARFEQRCQQNPQRCEEMKARIKERQEQCKVDPAKCPPAKGQPPAGK